MSETHAANALPLGSMIQEYRILKVLGAGSFGIVYQAENVYLDEVVAIKEFLPSDLACRTDGTRVVPLSSTTEEPYGWALRQFLKEAQILWDLARPNRHPNIIRVSRFHEDNGTAYMVMDFEQGQSLAQILEARGTLPEPELRRILDPLLDGLERVHAASVWHRDIKPGNVLVRSDGSPVLIDFGAARQDRGDRARSVMAMYSPAYAAPEQVMAMGEQGPWTDIYSLAATLYRAVTGRVPTGVSERALGVAHVPAAEAARGRYDPGLLHAIDVALSLQPAERPQSVAIWRQMFHTRAPPAAPVHGASTVLRPLARPPSVSADAPTRVVADFNPDAILPPAPHVLERPGARPAAAPPRTGRWLWPAIGAAGLAVAAVAGYLLLDAGTGGRVEPPRTAVAPSPPPSAPPTAIPDTPTTAPVPPPVSPPPAAPAPAALALATPPTTPAPMSTTPAPAAPSDPAPKATVTVQPAPTVAVVTPPKAAPLDRTAVAAAVSSAVAGFECAELDATLSADMKVFVTGRISSSRDQRTLESRLGGIEHVRGVVPQLEVVEHPFCDVLDLLGPFGLAAGHAGRKGPAITVNSPTRTFREGEHLVAEVTAGREDRGHLYVAYMDSTGTFVHMIPNPARPANALAPGQRVVLGAPAGTDDPGQRHYEITPPHGRGLILALVSRRPLFDRPRPEIEPAADYLGALDAQLAKLRGDEVVASALFIETRP